MPICEAIFTSYTSVWAIEGITMSLSAFGSIFVLSSNMGGYSRTIRQPLLIIRVASFGKTCSLYQCVGFYGSAVFDVNPLHVISCCHISVGLVFGSSFTKSDDF